LYVTKQITWYRGVILSRNTFASLVQMPSEKKKRSCPFSSATARRKKPKKSFSSDWAEKLAESDKGSYFDQDQWLKELIEQPSAECDRSVSTSMLSASRSKITVEEPLADLESENTEAWQKLHGHAIVAGERLQEKINESVTSRFCQGSVELVENLGSKNGLGSTWMFQCQNESCPSHETNNLAFPTTEKSRAFAINRASALGFRAIGGGQAVASKVFSFSRSIAYKQELLGRSHQKIRTGSQVVTGGREVLKNCYPTSFISASILSLASFD